MSKILYPALAITLAMAVIVASAFLPHLFGSLADTTATGRVQTAQLREGALEFQVISLAEVFALLNSDNTAAIDVTSSDVVLDREALPSLIEEALQPYIDAELIENTNLSFTQPYITANPILLYTTDGTGRSNIFWNVTVEYVGESSQSLKLVINDQTGHLLAINALTCYQYSGDHFIVDAEQRLLHFADIYFAEIGFTIDPQEYGVFDRAAESNADTRGALDVRWEDAAYGAMRVVFEITQSSISNAFATDTAL